MKTRRSGYIFRIFFAYALLSVYVWSKVPNNEVLVLFLLANKEKGNFSFSLLSSIMNALYSSYLKYSSPVSCTNRRFQLVQLFCFTVVEMTITTVVQVTFTYLPDLFRVSKLKLVDFNPQKNKA